MEESWRAKHGDLGNKDGDLVAKRRLKQQRQAEINARKDGCFFSHKLV